MTTRETGAWEKKRGGRKGKKTLFLVVLFLMSHSCLCYCFVCGGKGEAAVVCVYYYESSYIYNSRLRGKKAGKKCPRLKKRRMPTSGKTYLLIKKHRPSLVSIPSRGDEI